MIWFSQIIALIYRKVPENKLSWEILFDQGNLNETDSPTTVHLGHPHNVCFSFLLPVPKISGGETPKGEDEPQSGASEDHAASGATTGKTFTFVCTYFEKQW